MIGQVVLLRLADQCTLAAIEAEYSPDDVDLRAFALYSDGSLGVVRIPHATRGAGVNQWTDPAWPAPQLGEVTSRLMPASSISAGPLPPLMVIVRHG